MTYNISRRSFLIAIVSIPLSGCKTVSSPQASTSSSSPQTNTPTHTTSSENRSPSTDETHASSTPTTKTETPSFGDIILSVEKASELKNTPEEALQFSQLEEDEQEVILQGMDTNPYQICDYTYSGPIESIEERLVSLPEENRYLLYEGSYYAIYFSRTDVVIADTASPPKISKLKKCS